MHTLYQVKSGELKGIKRLSLSENLTLFPLEVLSLADSLEILDLSNNKLTSIPPEIGQLTHLKILFASQNCFKELPEALGLCENLEMIGFKSNQITQVYENSLPAKLRWLILTDNKIELLPDSLGERPLLQKLALAGNQLKTLPDTLVKAKNLELIRISANKLTQFPEQLFQLPKLAWLAFAGNPFTESNIDYVEVPEVGSTCFTLEHILGQGASGIISKARWNKIEDTFPENNFPNDIAVKVFKGEITSDGYPKDELAACLKVGKHINLVQSLAQVNEPGYLALIMNLIPEHYRNLGFPPSLQTCTRDIFADDFILLKEQLDKIVKQMTDVFEHLHNNKVCHGDLYAHNTLVDNEANIIFGDFGAATMYHMLSEDQQVQIKQIEQRALNYFIDDLTLCFKRSNVI